jgi:hypothetical protein
MIDDDDGQQLAAFFNGGQINPSSEASNAEALDAQDQCAYEAFISVKI